MADFCTCGHPSNEHGQERGFFYTDSRRELCLMCPGYAYENDTPMYPYGKAWHRFKPAAAVAPQQEGTGE